MKTIITKIQNPTPEELLHKEWLVANGIGGYALGSIGTVPTRKYHALLMAALPAPHGRTTVLNYVADSIVLADKKEIPLSGLHLISNPNSDIIPLTEFRLEEGLPVWKFQYEDIILEKNLVLIYNQNTVHVTYRLLSSKTAIEIKWRPFFHFRSSEQPVDIKIDNEAYTVHMKENYYEIDCPNFPILRLHSFDHAAFTIDNKQYKDVFYSMEKARGYESVGRLTSPGFYTAILEPNKTTSFGASVETWETFKVLNPEEAFSTEKLRRKRVLKASGIAEKSEVIAKLILAADQFIMMPKTRHQDITRLNALDEEVRSIIAGFPWFTDWGRDTMISLEGLTLTTNRSIIAHSILRTYAYYIKEGLIPNMFPDGQNSAYYNTADATLWYFQAVSRYIAITKDDDILDFLIPKFIEIVNKHIKGTCFGIKVDQDGLLMQGEKGIQLTWMDAKVGDWVVTPRHGKAVEINALWYNALRLLEKWTGKYSDLADRCFESFNKRFWFEKEGYLYDVVDGEKENDDALRPNQLFSISLDCPVLDKRYWKSVVEIVKKELLTPYGLRTLAPKDSNFKAFYEGDLLARDAAYHQGTVWPWLIGPFIDAWLKVYPDDYKTAREFLKGLENYLQDKGMGTISEIFDASDPYHARGCFAQAWSVAEVLRCLAKFPT